jgi:phage gp29-like protein
MPTSYIYDTYGIPEPEDGEAIAKTPVKGNAPGDKTSDKKDNETEDLRAQFKALSDKLDSFFV